MSCILEGNVQHLLQVIQLRRIVDQLMFWALRIFKPWVIECSKFWYEKASEEGSDEEIVTDPSDSENDLGSEESNSQLEESDTDQTTPTYRPPKRRNQASSSSPAARSRC